jgi:hypothetical protein
VQQSVYTVVESRFKSSSSCDLMRDAGQSTHCRSRREPKSGCASGKRVRQTAGWASAGGAGEAEHKHTFGSREVAQGLKPHRARMPSLECGSWVDVVCRRADGWVAGGCK